MRRLYLQIYLAFVAIVLVFLLLSPLVRWLSPGGPHERLAFDGSAALVGEVLPPPTASSEELDAALERLGDQFGAQLTLRSPDGTLVAASGSPIAAPRRKRERSGWYIAGYHRPTLALHLPDGRWLLANAREEGVHAYAWLAWLAAVGAAVAIGAYPLARRLVRRLETLRTQVEELGSGDLTARVEVKGADEIAALARSFNRAAERIEKLVESQRSTLWGASHELRSPLARMRVAIELLEAGERPDLRDQIAHDIDRLDDLIGELLLASRLDASSDFEKREPVDVLALVAEAAAESGATVEGDPVLVDADPRLLRRLVQNLLDNALRYGAGSAIEASVRAHGGSGAVLRVEDRGPGVPEAERERIFEPFYRPPGRSEGDDGGFGLGLALVRRIAERHGGSARCLERPGGGTCFEVVLA